MGRADVGIGPYGCVTRSAVQWAVGDAGPYGTVCRGGRPCPPGPITQRFVGQGPRALSVRWGKRIPRSRFCRDLGDGGCGLPRARCALAMTYLCTLCTHHTHYYLYIGKIGAAKDLLKEDFEDGEARKEDRRAFLRRATGEGLRIFEGDSIAYGYRTVPWGSAGENARQVQNIM